MLEPVHDQAAGLLAWNLQPPTRVLAVVASEQGSASLELLWRLRQGCESIGVASAVVEGLPGAWPDDRAQAGSVWLWHTSADAAATWWPAEGGRPLVALTAQPAALVCAYRALKVLRQAGLQPVVVTLPDEMESREGRAGDRALAPLNAALSALQRTCRTHLGWIPAAWRLGYHDYPSAEPGGEAVLSKILDAAWMLDAPSAVEGGRRPC